MNDWVKILGLAAAGIVLLWLMLADYISPGVFVLGIVGLVATGDEIL